MRRYLYSLVGFLLFALISVAIAAAGQLMAPANVLARFAVDLALNFLIAATCLAVYSFRRTRPVPSLK